MKQELQFRINIEATPKGNTTILRSNSTYYSQSFFIDPTVLLKPKWNYQYIKEVVKIIGKIILFVRECSQKG